MKTTKENTLFIGDQIFTDVLGAKRAGLYTIMVKTIQQKEQIQIDLKRYLERIVLFFYFRSIRKKSVEKQRYLLQNRLMNDLLVIKEDFQI